MIRVGFDRQAFTIQKYGGVSRYFADLYLGLKERQDLKAELLFNKHQNQYLHDQGIGGKLKPTLANAYERAMIKSKWRVSISSRVDIHHSTFYLGNPPRGRDGRKLVSTLYDMTPELFPQYFKGKPHANKLDWFRESDLIISISEAAASDLAYFQPQLTNKIQCIHLYSAFEAESPQSKPESIVGTRSPFFLFVGQRGAYKNVHLLLRAFASSEPKRHGNRLVFAGGGALSQEEEEEISRLQLYDHVIQLSVSDPELCYLYRNASAVLVPSLAEGFSLPLAEGLAADIPVICSDIPVHREVAQDFAYLVNPLQHDDWADILRATEGVLKPSIRLGFHLYRERLSYFSRERMLEEHVHAYKSLLH